VVIHSPGNARAIAALLQKSAAADGRSAISLRAVGSDPPALTPSTQLQRYAKHKVRVGGGRATCRLELASPVLATLFPGGRV